VTRAAARDVAMVAVTKAAIGAAVLLGGFRAVSDDDFARVVIAQTWAAAPHLDPTGTSWLPLPFWLQGGVMLLAGPSLLVARITAFALGVLAALLVHAAARLLVLDRRGALAGAFCAAILPWSARLGVATVPELPAAALTLFAIASLTDPTPRTRLLGALALFAACLCRYEPWPVAIVFTLFTLRDTLGHDLARAPALGAIALALAAPALWIAHNARAHGDPFHFLARVAAYKRALGGGEGGLAALAGYPLALLREEPEVCVLAAVLLVAALARRRPLPRSFARVALALAVLLAALTAAAVPGGAPTHHAGRALLTLWLAAAIYVGDASLHALRSRARHAHAALVAAVMLVGVTILRPWYARLDSFTARHDETTLGAAVAANLPRDTRVLLEVRDYAYYAVQAAAGAPPRFVLDRRLDPRLAEEPSSFTTAAALTERLRALGVDYAVGHPSDATAELEEIARAGDWGLWKVRP
jgi:dolichyl-phosphate-mannose-protein mannosyltransferase